MRAISANAARVVAAHIEEATGAVRSKGKARRPSVLEQALDAEPAEQVAILRAAFMAMLGFSQLIGEINERNLAVFQDTGHYPNFDLESWNKTHEKLGAVIPVCRRLLQKRQVFQAFALEDVVYLVRVTCACPTSVLYLWPIAALAKRIEDFLGDGSLAPDLRDQLAVLAERTATAADADTRKLTSRITALLSKAGAQLVLIDSPFGRQVMEFVKDLDALLGPPWQSLLELILSADTKARPSAEWLVETKARIAPVSDSFARQVGAWLDNFTPDPHHPEPNVDFIRGLVWAAALVEDDRLTSSLGRLCERSYKKVPGVGPASIKLGNACLYALGALPGEHAVAQLVRLKSRIKFNQGRKQLEKALLACAERAGLTVEDLEEMALPDFGLRADGSLEESLGDVVAEIRIAGSDEVTLGWTGPDGKPRKTVPASVKADHADELKTLRGRLKEIKGLLSGQRWRLESLYLQDRSWSLADWRGRYRDHPLMANLTRRLIWRFEKGRRKAAAVPVDEGFIDPDGKRLDWLGDDTRVSLWHPIEAAADEVMAWRRRLAALDITQPFKQAHREIYLLTDAERATEIYSNRFAAHVLRQHQMNALCQARAWRYNLQGAWDQEKSVPTRALPRWRLMAEFWTGYISDDHLDSGVYLYRASDQVRFLGEGGEPLRLEEVPPLVFSEVLRDVDLFVGVASVGNDPNWQDGGPDGRFRDYWWGYSFGDLGESAKTRRAVLETLLPKLKIADRSELQDKFLSVRGSKRTYKIHLGSGNILMTPNDQYLCIVPDHRKALGGAKVRLPFEGDHTFSLILSKAFLLAEDDKITDPTIISQIGR